MRMKDKSRLIEKVAKSTGYDPAKSTSKALLAAFDDMGVRDIGIEGRTSKIFSPQLWIDDVWAYLPYVLHEAQREGAKRQARAEDFVRRYPMSPKRKRGKA